MVMLADRLVEGEGRNAYLAVGDHADSAWFHAFVDALRAYEREGGDPIDGLRLLLVNTNLEKAADIRARVHEAMMAVVPQTFIIR